MAMMEIVHYGDPILRIKCKPFQDFSRLETILEDLFDSMYEKGHILCVLVRLHHCVLICHPVAIVMSAPTLRDSTPRAGRPHVVVGGGRVQ